MQTETLAGETVEAQAARLRSIIDEMVSEFEQGGRSKPHALSGDAEIEDITLAQTQVQFIQDVLQLSMELDARNLRSFARASITWVLP